MERVRYIRPGTDRAIIVHESDDHFFRADTNDLSLYYEIVYGLPWRETYARAAADLEGFARLHGFVRG